jgi:hypothetical protein
MNRAQLLHQLLKGKLLCLMILMNLFSLKSYSQTPERGETVAYINKILGDRYRVTCKNTTLVVSFYNENGEIVREDKVPTMDLDLKITYEPEDGLLCIPCMKDQPECLTRVLTLQKIKKGYGRFSIPVKDEKAFNSLKIAFEHLIRATSENGYKEAVILD